MWALSARNLIKYDLNTSSQIQNISLSNFPGMAGINLPNIMIAQTNNFGETNIYIAVSRGEANSYSNNFLIRIKETGYAAFTSNIITCDDWNTTGAADKHKVIQSIIINPANPGELILACIYRSYSKPQDSLIMKSTDGRGETWSIYYNNDFREVYELAMDNNGTLFGVSGYHSDSQQNISDYLHFGACAVGGGLNHYDLVTPGPSTGYQTFSAVSGYTSSPYYSTHVTEKNQIPQMSFMLLDGHSMAESRFGIFNAYPSIGSGGYYGHMHIMDPKCAPYAPRVDEDNTVFNLGQTNIISIKLYSPGLYNTVSPMDGFFSNTINETTVTLTNAAGNITPQAITYLSNTKEIQFIKAGDFSQGIYYLTLKCGVDGIKNYKGAALINARPNEFKEEVTYVFTVNYDGTPNANLDHFGIGEFPDNVVKDVSETITIIAYDASGQSNFTPFTGFVRIYTEPEGGFTPIMIEFTNQNNNVYENLEIKFQNTSVSNYSIKIAAVDEGITNSLKNVTAYLFVYSNIVIDSISSTLAQNAAFDYAVKIAGPGDETNGVLPYTG
ncbi:MAG TPA: hypothetical protein DC049_01890, partial [Spirochaetia bacterium]|nr:hypothetical protein [Spirochaetia bacterium]